LDLSVICCAGHQSYKHWKMNSQVRLLENILSGSIIIREM
jgi:hypothetical protein